MKASDNHLPDWPAKIQTAAQANRISAGPRVECVVEESSGSLYLARLRVPKASQGKGLGSALIEKLKERARRLHKPITLTFNPDEDQEDRVRRFYKKHGFRFLSDNITMIWRP